MGDEFGTDADGDFRHGLRADVDAERGVDLGQRLARDTFGGEVLENHLDLPPAADQADVAGAAIGQVEQRLLIVAVAAGDDQAVRIAA